MWKEKLVKIKCPVCGWEYLPEEVYVKILGKPQNIVRNEKGQIIHFTGDSIDPEEDFTCEHCKTELKIILEPKFKIEYDVWEDESWENDLDK